MLHDLVAEQKFSTIYRLSTNTPHFVNSFFAALLATTKLEFIVTVAADAQDGIVGYASRAKRRDRIGRSTLARNETRQPSACSGGTLLRAKATHR